MREILFRGKRTDNGTWAYGYLFCIWERTYLCWGTTNDVPNMKEVIPETVGQYTGLTDKNGVRIFEGDILVGFLDEEYPEHETVVVVEWHENMWVTRQGKCHPDLLEQSDLDCFEVVGNIHDNPELLETAAKPAAKNIAQSGLAPATENFELMEG